MVCQRRRGLLKDRRKYYDDLAGEDRIHQKQAVEEYNLRKKTDEAKQSKEVAMKDTIKQKYDL